MSDLEKFMLEVFTNLLLQIISYKLFNLKTVASVSVVCKLRFGGFQKLFIITVG